MLLVTQGKGRINQLGFDKKTSEYVYIHKGQEIWREKGDTNLLDIFNKARGEYTFPDMDEVRKNPIYVKYEDDCDAFYRKENPWIYR